MQTAHKDEEAGKWQPRSPRSAAAPGVRRLVLWLIVGSAAGGCAAPVVFENPATHQRVDCTAEAKQRVTSATGRTPGTRPPEPKDPPDNLLVWDLEHRCAAELKRAGFVCVSGC